ncbi:hypothetical protein PT2222_10227 [Paraburkholderia tropica]
MRSWRPPSSRRRSGGGLRGGLLRGLHGFGALEHGLHDVVIARTAAQIAVEVRAHVRFGQARTRVRERHRAHHHAGRAEAALQAVAVAESGLHRMHRAVGGETFDRRHVHAVALHGERVARFDRAAVQMHGARAALGRVAADVRAGETPLLAQKLDQKRVRFDLGGHGLAVDREAEADRHGLSPVARSDARASRPGTTLGEDQGPAWPAFTTCPEMPPAIFRPARVRIGRRRMPRRGLGARDEDKSEGESGDEGPAGAVLFSAWNACC